MTPCEQTVLYFYGELPPEQQQQAQAHIKQCPACQREMAFLAQANAALLPPSAPQSVVQRVLDKTIRKQEAWAWLKPAFISAAVMGVGVFIFVMGQDASRLAYEPEDAHSYLSAKMDAEYQSFSRELEDFESDF